MLWPVVYALPIVGTYLVLDAVRNLRKAVMSNADKLVQLNTRIAAIGPALSKGFTEVSKRLADLQAQNPDLDFGPANEALGAIEVAVAALDALTPDANPEAEDTTPGTAPEPAEDPITGVVPPTEAPAETPATENPGEADDEASSPFDDVDDTEPETSETPNA